MAYLCVANNKKYLYLWMAQICWKNNYKYKIKILAENCNGRKFYHNLFRISISFNPTSNVFQVTYYHLKEASALTWNSITAIKQTTTTETWKQPFTINHKQGYKYQYSAIIELCNTRLV